MPRSPLSTEDAAEERRHRPSPCRNEAIFLQEGEVCISSCSILQSNEYQCSSVFLGLKGSVAENLFYFLEKQGCFLSHEPVRELTLFDTNISPSNNAPEACLAAVCQDAPSHPTPDRSMSPCREPGGNGLSRSGGGREGDTEEIHLVCSSIFGEPQWNNLLTGYVEKSLALREGVQDSHGTMKPEWRHWDEDALQAPSEWDFGGASRRR